MTTISRRDEAELADRYQNQSWLVRRWRDRYLLKVPFAAIRMWLSNLVYWDEPLLFHDAWHIACGLCDMERNWVYSWEEIKARRLGR